QTNLVDHSFAHKVIATRDPITMPHRCMIPAHVVNHPGALEKSQQSHAMHKRVPRGREVACRGMYFAVTRNELHPENAALGIGIHVSDGLGNRIRFYKCIRIDEKYVPATCPLERLIGSPTEADIGGVRD